VKAMTETMMLGIVGLLVLYLLSVAPDDSRPA
jgi:hypothetical protein